MTTRKQKASAQPISSSIQTRSRLNLNTPAGTQGETTANPLPPPPPPQAKIRVPKRVRKQFRVDLIEQRRRTLRSSTMTTSSHDSDERVTAQIEGESSVVVVCGVEAKKGESALSEKIEGVEKGELPIEGAENDELKETEGEEKGKQPIEGANSSESKKEGDEADEYDSAKEEFMVDEVRQEQSIDLNRDPKSTSLKTTEEAHDKEGDEDGNTSARTTSPIVADPEGGPDSDPTAEEPDEDAPLSSWNIRNINKGKSISGAGVSLFPGQESNPLRRIVKTSEKPPRKKAPTSKSTPRSIGTRSSSKGPPAMMSHFPHEEPLQETPSSKSKKKVSSKKDQGTDTGSSQTPGQKDQGKPAGPSKRKAASSTAESESDDSPPQKKTKGANEAAETLALGKILIPSIFTLYGCVDFLEPLKFQGWDGLFLDKSHVVAKRDVLGFYRVCSISKARVLSAKFKGVEISVKAEDIGRILEVGVEGFRSYSKLGWPELEEPHTPERICQTLTGNPSLTTAKKLHKKDLTNYASLTYMFVIRNILPKKEKRGEPSFLELTLTYLLLQRIKINLPAILIRHLKHCLKKSHVKPYGFLMTRILVGLGVSLSEKAPVRVVDHFDRATFAACGFVKGAEFPEPAPAPLPTAPASAPDPTPVPSADPSTVLVSSSAPDSAAAPSPGTLAVPSAGPSAPALNADLEAEVHSLKAQLASLKEDNEQKHNTVIHLLSQLAAALPSTKPPGQP